MSLKHLGVSRRSLVIATAAIATRGLPADLVGAAAGVYSATRHVGSTLGSAGVAVLMSSRTAHAPFSEALSQVMLLPVAVAVFGCVVSWRLNDDGHVRRCATQPNKTAGLR